MRRSFACTLVRRCRARRRQPLTPNRPRPPPPPRSQPFAAGPPLKLTPNAKTYGGFRFAESLSYDAERDLYVAVNAGMAQEVVPNDGYIALINPDGTAHTLKWIGVNRNGLTLNHPLGSDIANGMLYVVDIDTVRWFDMKTGEPKGQRPGAGRDPLQRSRGGGRRHHLRHPDRHDRTPTTWKVYKITPQGQAVGAHQRRAAQPAQRHRLRCQGQPGGGQHRHQRRAHLLARRQAGRPPSRPSTPATTASS